MQSFGNLSQVLISVVLCLVDVASHCVHEGAVVPIGRPPIRSGASLVNLEQLEDSAEKVALEIPLGS